MLLQLLVTQLWFLVVLLPKGKSGVKVNKVEEDAYGVQTITLNAALGVLEEGAILVVADVVHATTAKPKVDLLPTGLLWHDIVKEGRRYLGYGCSR